MKKTARRKLALTLSLIMSLGLQRSVFASDTYKAYMKGYPDGSFNPAKVVTRAEVAVMISNLIRDGEQIDRNVEFTDVKKGNWAYDSVNYLRTKNIISSDNGGKYSVKDDMSRAELCSVIVKAYNLTKEDGVSKKFSDIEKNEYKDYIEIMVSNGYMSGYPDGTFKPDKKVSRAEIASILNDVLGRPKAIEELKKMNGNLVIPKDVSINYWAYSNIVSAINDLKEQDTVQDNITKDKKEEKILEKADKKHTEKVDYKNLKDGEYKISVDMLKAEGQDTPSELSMANGSIEHKAMLNVENGKAKLYLVTKPMALKSFGEQKGHLQNAWYYGSKEDYYKSLTDKKVDNLKSVEIIDKYNDKAFDAEDVKSYPKTIAFPVEIGTDFIYIKIEVDVMNSLGGIKPDAAIKLDWSSLEK
ncbi:hypothetical protein HMPREF9628_00851 [Peptoanaerobacter stomatis]|uniref:SLH domain protein n=1 Tax=Peptoanaerobacter stomatis TaxID=796937 RepID=G9XG86_9FIRM|nr:S-layer homology domain-containing protein [Peptoanaerobacter stomatis]EHL15200.1 hypothetical protein HMPREF9628_00851 [Peptoanaerobacter stomatis]